MEGKELSQYTETIGMASSIPILFARIGGEADALVNGEYGARAVKIGLRLAPLRRLQWFSRFSPLAFSITTVSTLFAGIAATTSLVEGRCQEEKKEAQVTLGHTALLVGNLMSRTMGAAQLPVQLLTALAGGVWDLRVLVVSLREEKPWYDDAARIGMFLLWNSSPREWRGHWNKLLITSDRRQLQRAGLSSIVEWDGGVRVHRVELPDGSYVLKNGNWLRSVDRSRRPIQILSPGKTICFDSRHLGRTTPGRMAIYYRGAVYEYRGQTLFEDEFGNRLRTVFSGRERRVTVRPEVQFIHPHPPKYHDDLTTLYRGRSFRLRPHPTLQDHYFAAPVSRIDREQYLFRYDSRKRSFEFARETTWHPVEGQDFFYEGRRYETGFWETQGAKEYFVGRSTQDPRQFVALKRGEDRKMSLLDRALLDDPIEVEGPSKYLSYRGRSYEIDYRDRDFVYARSLDRTDGMEESWFVGRVVQDDFVCGWRTAVPLPREEMRGEFGHQLKRLEGVGWAGKVGWALGQRLPMRIAPQAPNSFRWETRGSLVSGREIMMDQYKLVVGSGHEIDLYLPRQKERFYSLNDWLRLLRDLPPRALYSTKTIFVAPQTERLVEQSVGRFNYGRQEMKIQDGFPSVPRVREVLFHEMVGHGFERDNGRIKSMIVLAMKLDRRWVTQYGTKNVFEYHAEGANFLHRYPQARRFYPYQWRLVSTLSEVNPQDIPIARGTMWFHKGVGRS